MAATELTQRRTRFSGVVAPTLAGALVLIASFFNFIASNDYPFVKPEVGITIAILCSSALFAGVIYGYTGTLGRVVLEVTITIIAVDLNFSGIMVIYIIFPLFFIIWLRRLPLFLSVVSVIVMLSLFVEMNQKYKSDDEFLISNYVSKKPALLHLILDEHIGVDGILGSSPQAINMRDRIRDFYLRNGFRLNSGAYSEYFRTLNSVPDILNYRTQKTMQGKIRIGMNAGANKYFNDLGEMGYRIHVFQTYFLGYCNNEFVDKCVTTKALDALILDSRSLSSKDKAVLMLVSFVKLSRFLRTQAFAIDKVSSILNQHNISLPSPRLEEKKLPLAAGALEVLEKLRPSLREARAGDAFFVHVLFPHSPFVMDEDCRLKPVVEWVSHWSVSTVEQSNDAYYDQLDCVLVEMGKILDAIPEDTIVIVHGDHGSRIGNHDPVVEEMGRFSEEDLITGYSTLFAARSKKLPGGEIRGGYPVSQLLKALVDSSFSSTEFSEGKIITPSIVLEDNRWRPREQYELPAWWVNGNNPMQ